MIIRQDYANALTDVPTQMLIAPVLPTMVSDRAYDVGEQFIVDSVLYKITTAVSAAGVALVVGTNCELADTVTEQIVSMRGGLVTVTYPTTSIPTGTLTTIATASLEANHTYLVVFNHDWTSGSAGTNIATASRIRWTPSSGTGTTMAIIRDANGIPTGGGGVSMSAIITTTINGTIDGDASQTSGSTKTVSNVSFKVYRLD